MMEQTYEYIAPRYVGEFDCTGSACSDNCCRGWRITFDRAAYERYKANPKLEDLCSRHLSIEKNGTDDTYAVLVPMENGDCPFIKEGLCGIQLNYGEEYLSSLCMRYPRITNKINGQMERAMTLSCPEAARLALLSPGAMEIVSVEESSSREPYINMSINVQPASLYNLIRSLYIDILKFKNYTLWERLIILGLFSWELEGEIIQNRGNSAAELAQVYRRSFLVPGRKLDISFEVDMEEQVRLQLVLLDEMLEKCIYKGENYKKYLGYYTEMRQGLDLNKKSQDRQTLDVYAAALQGYLYPMLKKHGYILENYLLNEIIRKAIPFRHGEDIFGEYMLLAIHYAMLKLHLAGICATRGRELMPKEAVDFISSYVRAVDHNWNNPVNLLKVLRDSGNAHMTCMAMLVTEQNMYLKE